MSDVPALTSENGGLRIRVPMALKRRGGRKEIVVPEGLPRRRRSAPQAHGALVLAVVRGHRWKELLESGRYTSIDALAARMGVDSSYLGRHLNLALLAPDIVEAILMGREPDGLSLGRGEQRRVLGQVGRPARLEELAVEPHAFAGTPIAGYAREFEGAAAVSRHVEPVG